MWKHEGKFQFAVFGLPVIGAALIMNLFLWFGPYGMFYVLLAVPGVVLFCYAKISEKKRTKRPLSFGLRNMTIKERIAYLSGYFLMMSAVSTLLILSSH